MSPRGPGWRSGICVAAAFTAGIFIWYALAAHAVALADWLFEKLLGSR